MIISIQQTYCHDSHCCYCRLLPLDMAVTDVDSLTVRYFYVSPVCLLGT